MASQTAGALDRLHGAHSALLKQADLQFQLSQAAPPHSPLLDWLAKALKPVGDALAPALRAMSPMAPYIFWGGVAIGAAFILFLIGQRLFAVNCGLTLGGLKLAGGLEPWRPAPDQARALIEEADRLAAEGRFVEAAHLILLRSIQDIQSRRPRAVAVSLTSRDIARLEALPPPARTLFAGIAEAVEISLFGGRALDGEGYARCRDAYKSFAEAGELGVSLEAVSEKPASEGGFSPKVVLSLIAATVFAASAFALLTAYAPELRAARGGGAHAQSRSAIGYAGVVRLMGMITGEPVVINQDALARSNYPGLMVLTPQGPGALTTLNSRFDRLIVLPKWAAEPDPAHPGWQANAVIGPGFLPAVVLPKALKDVILDRRGPGERGPVNLTSPLALWPETGLQPGRIDQFQTISGGGLKALVKDDEGRMVLGVARGGTLYVLSDPDLLNTQGLRDPRTARIAATILLALKVDGQPIAFDVSATEAGGQKSLLRLAIEPPFLAATLCLLIVAALVGVQAWFRFGPPRRAGRAVALGKTALVETGAGMVRLAKREPRMARRYVQLCRLRAAEALGAGRLEGEALDAFLDRWAERVGAQERISVLSAEAAQVNDIVGLTALAQRARRWRLEVMRGS